MDADETEVPCAELLLPLADEALEAWELTAPTDEPVCDEPELEAL